MSELSERTGNYLRVSCTCEASQQPCIWWRQHAWCMALSASSLPAPAEEKNKQTIFVQRGAQPVLASEPIYSGSSFKTDMTYRVYIWLIILSVSDDEQIYVLRCSDSSISRYIDISRHVWIRLRYIFYLDFH